MQKEFNDRKIKILVVIPSLIMGGAERLTVNVLNNLNRNRFELALCLFENKGILLKKVPNDIKIFDLQKRSKWSFFRLIIRLNKVIREYKPDIVYSRMWYATSVVAFVRFLYKKRFKLIAAEEHNHKRDILPSNPYGKVKRFLLDWSYRSADRVIVLSEGVKREITLSYGLEPDKIDVIYASVDITLIKKKITEKVNHSWFKDEIPVIAGFARLIYRKGFSDLLKAFSLVSNSIPVRLIIIGEGEDRLSLEIMARKLHIEERILFLGYQNNPFKFLAKSEILVLPSLWEGFAVVIIEAMACGVPVISTRCPYGPEEIIADGLNGLLVPVGDVEGMAQAILRLLSDEPLRKQLAKEGRKRAEDFKVERMVSRYEKLFEQVAAR